MSAKFSIAEARDKFAAIIRDVEETTQPVEVTRRGLPVAVILSTEQYSRLSARSKIFLLSLSALTGCICPLETSSG
jgi:prevent-host-death family protein